MVCVKERANDPGAQTERRGVVFPLDWLLISSGTQCVKRMKTGSAKLQKNLIER
jgi:hypothetical protein